MGSLEQYNIFNKIMYQIEIYIYFRLWWHCTIDCGGQNFDNILCSLWDPCIFMVHYQVGCFVQSCGYEVFKKFCRLLEIFFYFMFSKTGPKKSWSWNAKSSQYNSKANSDECKFCNFLPIFWIEIHLILWVKAWFNQMLYQIKFFF